jgi:glycosyltransferase involved in cell wall biosynthesis
LELRVLHVVASDQRRGAEVFAADLVRALGEQEVSQQVAVLRSGHGGVDYEAPLVDLRATHLLPGLRMDPGAVVGLSRVVRSRKPDVVQVHGGEALKYAVGATLGSRTPIVYRRIGSAPSWISKGLRRRLYGALMRRPARIVALAEAVRRETMSLFGVPAAQVLTIPNGVDSRRMRPLKTRARMRLELGVPGDAAILLSLAALTWEKDPLTHLAVASRVLDEVPGAIHLLAGDGPMRDKVEAEILRRGLGGRVLRLGVRADVADLMNASDVLLFASRGDGMEGLPTIMVEAGMVGLPVVAFDVAGVAEVIRDGLTGFLVPPGDVEDLARKASRLLADKHLHRSMVEAGQALCRDAFDVRWQVVQYVNVYRGVLRAR